MLTLQNSSETFFIHKQVPKMGAKKIFVALLILVFTIFALKKVGRTWLGKQDTFSLICLQTQSQCNSQRLFDAYTLTHISHGIIFYWIYLLAKKRIKMTFHSGFILALILESLWEVVENTSFIIDRYRTATFSLNYYGDSILNSLGDIAASSLTFLTVSTLPLFSSFLLFIALELMLIHSIRDSLLLNIIQLIIGSKTIANWQNQ